MGDITIFGIPVALGTMLYQAFIFTVLFWLLHKLCFKKIVDALDNRKKHIENQLTVTEKYKKEAKQKLEEQTKLLEETRREVLEMRKKCKEETEQLLKNARDEAYQIRAKAVEEQKKRLNQGA